MVSHAWIGPAGMGKVEEVCLSPIHLRPTRHLLAFPAWSDANVAFRVRWLYLIEDGYGGQKRKSCSDPGQGLVGSIVGPQATEAVWKHGC